MKRNWLGFFTHFFEYGLVFFIIITCNSLCFYVYGGSSDIRLMSFYFILFFLCCLIAIYGISSFQSRCHIKGILLLLGIIYAYIGILYVVNVRGVELNNMGTAFVRYVVIFLPLMILLFYLMRKTGHTYDLLYRYSDLVCIFSLISLVLFFIINFFPDVVLSDELRVTWSALGRISNKRSFFNICIISLSDFRNVHGLTVFRNYGFFPEPLMYCVPLLCALYTEMFLRPRTRFIVAKWILLSLVILTTQSTLGMMLAVFSWCIVLLEISSKTTKRIVLPIIVAVGVLCIWVLFRQKLSLTNDSSFSSMAFHLEDFKLGLKAFLSKPIFGGGFNNEAYIKSFMTEARSASNRGLSNSITVMLGNSGVVGGLFFLSPFAILVLQFWKKKNRNIAFWGINIFALYCIVIIYKTFFIYMIYAFGFSLIDINLLAENGLHLSLFPKIKNNTAKEKDESWFAFRRLFLVMAIIVIALFLVKKPLMSGLYRFFMTHQLMLGQAQWKFILLCLAMIFLCTYVCFRWAWTKRKLIFVGLIVAYQVVFALLYPALYSLINTGLQIQGGYSDAAESLIILIIYLFPIVVTELILYLYGLLPVRKFLAVAVGICLITILEIVGLRSIIWKEDNEEVFDLTDSRDTLLSVVQAAKGPVFSNDYAALYHKEIPGISYSTAKSRGFSVYPCVSVIFPHRRDERELFSQGFEMTEISESLILYTNDDAVINKLQEDGFTFYRYYPFAKKLLLRTQLKYNDLSMTENGRLIIDGAEHSLTRSTRYLLEPGEYTVTYRLHVAGSGLDPNEIICHPLITYNKGEDIAVYRDVKVSECDEKGNITLDIPITAGLWEDVEFLLLGEKTYQVQVKKISWTQTPTYITVKQTNGRDQAVREEFYQHDGSPYINADGYCARETEYNGVGQVTCVRYLNENDLPVLTRGKYAEIHYKYNNIGLVIEESYYGLDGDPCLQGNWSAGRRISYDASWNQNEFWHYGLNGEPVIINSGYSHLKRTFNDKNQIIREEYYNTEDQLCLLSSGYAICENEYDESGNVIAIRYHGLKDEPVLISDGYAEIRRAYNAEKQLVREEYYGTDGNLILINKGYAAQERAYDDYGNVSRYRYYGKNYEPVVMNDGYAEVRKVYNEKRQVIQETYYGTDGMRMDLAGGYSGVAYTYDATGNIVIYHYYDKADQTVVTSSGFAEIRREYDDHHQVIHEEYYGLDGTLTQLFAGQSMQETEYDSTGNPIIIRYLDQSGTPIMIRNGYAEVHREFNDRQQIIREEYFDTEGNLVLLGSGYASWERELNELGTVRWQKYYGVKGEPVLMSDGYFEVRREIDDEGKVLKESYYDTDGTLTVITKGYAVVVKSYTAEGKPLEDIYLDTEGNPAVTGVGYCKVHYDYNADHQLTLVHYLDPEGNETEAGSGYFHEYLQSLILKLIEGNNIEVLISVYDEATSGLTVTLLEDLAELGIKTDLRGHYRNNYYAVITSDSVVEDIAYDGVLTMNGLLQDGTPYSITSTSYKVGNQSSIIINGEEYSKNVRGMNFVVYDNETSQVIDSVAFDTYTQEMTVTR